MAINQLPDAFSLVLTLEVTGKDGKPAYKKYTYPQLRHNAQPDAIFGVALSLEKLHKVPLIRVNWINNYELQK